MKSLNGAEIASYMKLNQVHQAQSLRSNKIQPKLVIIRDSDNPVIVKYVNLKQQYGEDIGVVVEDWLREDVAEAIAEANADESVHGIIVQLPLKDVSQTDEIVNKITPEKDVDGLAKIYLAQAPDIPASPQENHLSSSSFGSSAYHEMNNNLEANASGEIFESATATAINWLLAGYDVKLQGQKIALVGRGRLVGAPLERMWRNSGYDVTVFRSHSDLNELKDFDVIVSATGVPHLIESEMVKPGAVVIDAGTASEDGVLVGDVDEAIRKRTDLSAITPKVGGVGPLTVTALFEHVLMAATAALNQQ